MYINIICKKVWDVLSDQEACDLVLKHEKAQDAAKMLLVQSIKSGSTDNISVVIVKTINIELFVCTLFNVFSIGLNNNLILTKISFFTFLKN